MSKTKVLLKEPLIHFILIGALVFAVHGLWQARQESAARTIIVSQEALKRLSAIWAGEAGREPNADDVRGLLAEYVREEVLYREAQRLGLDEDDTIIRRRLAQKMGFLLSNEAVALSIDESDLRARYDANPEEYREPTRITLTHVPFNFAPDGASRQDEIDSAARILNSATSPEPGSLGDPFILARSHIDIDEDGLGRLFGRDFAAAIFSMPVGQWSPSIRSRLADHLVRVEARTEGGTPPYEDVANEVARRETERLKRESEAVALDEIMQRYSVIIDDGAP